LRMTVDLKSTPHKTPRLIVEGCLVLKAMNENKRIIKLDFIKHYNKYRREKCE
jgi:hypothetical protein